MSESRTISVATSPETPTTSDIPISPDATSVNTEQPQPGDHSITSTKLDVSVEVVDVMGCKVHNVDLQQAVNWMLAEAQIAEPSFAVTPNVDHAVMLTKLPDFRSAYDQAMIRVADGMPLLWAARLKKSPLKQRVCGSDLILPLCAGAETRGLSVFLLGGRDGAAVDAAATLKKQFPTLNIAGTCCPPFGFHTNDNQNNDVIEQIREAKPDILFVGLGAPKQELWISENMKTLGVPFSIGIGAGIDFTAGYVERAPVWMQNSGLEWSYRIYRDKRLFKRYLWKDLPFIGYLAKLVVLRAAGRLKTPQRIP